MRIELTERSGLEVNRLAAADMTPAMAAQYLAGKIRLRGFWETLRSLCPAGDLRDRVAEALCQPGDDPKSVARRVRNWEQGKNAPTDREDLFRIAFGLELNEEQASILLGMCTDYGIHYRNGKELTYAYCLRKGTSYHQAVDLYHSLPDPERYPDRARQGMEDTRQLVSIFSDVRDDGDFSRLYEAYLGAFGTLHQRAWDYFDRYFQALLFPSAGEERYSIQRAMDTYLTLHMPSGSRRRDLTLIQRMLKQGWPNATKLKNICARKEDVPRKLLLLLYLVTENVVDGSYDELDEDYLSPEELFEEHW